MSNLFAASGRSPEVDLKTGPWGLWPTLGFSGFIILANFAAGTIAALGYVGATQDSIDPAQLASNGTLITLSILISSPVLLGLTFLFANLRRSISIKEYLALHDVGAVQSLKWLLILLGFAGAAEGIGVLLNRPLIEPFMLNVYATSSVRSLLWIALVIAAPLSEEIFFRGFLFYGILKTRLGGLGAILLSALIWAPLHLQYDLYGVATVLVIGLLLGYGRLKTGSVYIPIVMHALMNFIAGMEIMIYVAHFSPAP
jgi:uncharacterized protein